MWLSYKKLEINLSALEEIDREPDKKLILRYSNGRERVLTFDSNEDRDRVHEVIYKDHIRISIQAKA